MAKTASRVVLDSNVLISALAFGGKPKAVLEAGFKAKFALVSSAFIAEEVKRGLVKLGHSPGEAELLLATYETVAELVYPEELTPLSRDPNDDPILATARSGEADYIVTGDDDLLVLKRVEKTKIVKPADFLKKLGD